ncbi:MAG: HD domain-containing phosphohydrolase [Pseudomonadota bacterium]
MSIEWNEGIEKGRILVVDDEPTNLKLLNKLLGSQGYSNLVLVQDPRKVIFHYQEQRPDLILLDINMPHMDGFEVLEQLTELNDPLMPPVIILTAQNSRDYLLRALNAGARDFISKPFDRTELMARVRNMLEAYLAHRMVHDQKSVLDDLVRQRTEELRRTQLQMVQRLGKAAEYRDEETGNHIMRMSHISALIARNLGWSNDECELMLNASPMHDIGKIGVPDNILLKAGKLEPDEWDIMKAHTTIGAKMLDGGNCSLLKMAHTIALSHHERWDGTGYPNGLKGEEIPLAGRIAAVADTFDALTSERPYKKAWTTEKAKALIVENAGVQFDPELVLHFLECLPEIIAIRERFSE